MTARTLFLALALALVCSPTLSTAQPDARRTGSAEAASQLRVGEIQQGRISQRSTTGQRGTAWTHVRVEITEPGDYRFHLNSDDFDAYLYLLDAAGERVIAFDDDGGVGFNAMIRHRINAPGTYILEATSFDGRTPGAFTLLAEPIVYRRPQAQSISLGDTVAGQLNDREDALLEDGRRVRIYETNMEAGMSTVIQLSLQAADGSPNMPHTYEVPGTDALGGSVFDGMMLPTFMQVDLIGPSGFAVQSWYVDGAEEHLTLEILEGGLHRIVISQYENTPPLTFSMRVRQEPVRALEPRSLAFDRPTRGRLDRVRGGIGGFAHVQVPSEIWQVDVPAHHLLLVTLSTPNFIPQVSVSTNDGRLYTDRRWEDHEETSQLAIPFDHAGRAILIPSQFGVEGGGYTIEARILDLRDGPSLERIRAGETETLRLHPGRGIHPRTGRAIASRWYRSRGGEDIRVEVRSESDVGMRLHIVRPDGAILSSAARGRPGITEHVRLPERGRYLIVVEAESFQETQATLRLAPDRVPEPGARLQALEPGTPRSSTLDPLALSAVISRPEGDRWALDVQEAGPAVIRLEAEGGSGIIHLIAPDGAPRAQLWLDAYGTEVRHAFHATPGRWVVAVNNEDDMVLSYTVAWDTDLPTPRVQRITVGATERGALADHHWREGFRHQPARVYRLELDAGASVQIDLRSENFDAYLFLVDEFGIAVAIDDDGGEGLNSRIHYTSSTGGTYRILATRFHSGSGSFELSVAPR